MTRMTLDKLPLKVLARIDLQTAFTASQCVLAAEKLQLFRKLHGKKLTAAAIGRATGIRGWRLGPYLSALVGLGLLKREGKLYRNSALADKHYVRDRSIYWTRLYSRECEREYEAFSALERMLTTGKDYQSILGIERDGYVDSMKKDPTWAHDFTHLLYHDHLPVARAVAGKLDLRKYNRVLDVGGGSGVMLIPLLRKYKHLTATVLDIEAVVQVTRKIIKRERLQRRMDAIPGDMTRHIPRGYDVIMLCDVDHPEELLSRVYDSLPSGGMLVLAEDFSNDDLTEPFHKLMWQLRSSRMWVTPLKQAVDGVRKAGFRSIKSVRLPEQFHLITGYKGRKR